MLREIVKNRLVRMAGILALALAMLAPEAEAQSRKERKRLKKQQEEQAKLGQAADESGISRRDKETAEALFVEGMKYFLLEDYPKAVEGFQKSLLINPKNAAVNYKLAETNLLMGNVAIAQKFAEDALRLDPKNSYYYLLLAQIYSGQSKYDEAAKIYSRLIKDVPNSEEYQYNLAELYIAQNKYDEAAKALEKLEATYGVNEEISRKKQQLYLRQNKLSEAITEGEKLIASNPEEPRYLLQQAELLFSNNRPDQAVEMLARVRKVDPSNAQAALMLSDMLRAQGKTIEADEQLIGAFDSPSLDIDTRVKLLVNFIQRMPNPELETIALKLADLTIKHNPKEAKAYAVAGDIQGMAGRKKEARDNYLKAIKLDNSHYKIWQQIILIDAELQQNDSLVVHSDKALELFPNQGIFWFYNGTAHLIKNNPAKAVRALEQGRKLSADNPELIIQFNSQLGDAYNSLKQYQKSDEAYDEVLNSDATNAHVLNNYSYFLSLRKEHLEKAKSLSQKLVTQYPTEATYLDTHAWVLYQLKDYANARKFLEQAVQGTPSGTVVEHYGDVLYQLGEKEKAVEQWQKAKKLGEGSEFLDKKIKDRKLYE